MSTQYHHPYASRSSRNVSHNGFSQNQQLSLVAGPENNNDQELIASLMNAVDSMPVDELRKRMKNMTAAEPDFAWGDFHFHPVKTAISTRKSSFFNTKHNKHIENTTDDVFTYPSRNQSAVQRSRHLPSNLTIVTAYWNLGTFRKGSRNMHFSTKTYFKWATIFKHLVNPLVVYTDSEEFRELIERLRSDRVNNTMIYLTNRTDFWPFRLLNDVRSVYNVPGYPKKPPEYRGSRIHRDSTFQIRGGDRHRA